MTIGHIVQGGQDKADRSFATLNTPSGSGVRAHAMRELPGGEGALSSPF